MELNKYAVIEQIEKECTELAVMVANHEKAIRSAVEKSNAYELLYAKTWLEIIGGKLEGETVLKTVDDKKQKVSEICSEAKFQAELAEELSKSLAEAIRVKVEVLGAHRSILSSLKSEEDNQPANDPTGYEPDDDEASIPDWAK